MRKILLLIFVIVAVNQCFAQMSAGKIEYEISFPNADLPAEQLAMMPSEAVVYFSDQLSRTEMKMGMGVNMVTIHSAKQVVMLMDIMGKKIAIKQPADDQTGGKNKKKKADIKITDETKQIAGYTCKKAIVSGEQIEHMSIWFTDQIQSSNSWNDELEGLKGTALEFDLKTDQMTMHMMAQAVSNERPGPSLFVVPSDYKEMSQDELKSLFGGNE